MTPERQTDLVLLYLGGSNSSERGVAYPVVLRNEGTGTFWDVDVRVTHDGEETDRKVVRQVRPQSEAEPVSLLIPAKFCDEGTPGVGLRPLGKVVAEALVKSEAVASVDLPGGTTEAEIDRVPRTAEEVDALLRTRPEGWGYLLFASVLRQRMDALEPKYRDHELRFTKPQAGPTLTGSDATDFLSHAFREAREMVGNNFARVFSVEAQEKAFGAGDADRIEHLATRVIDIYESLLDWPARVRGTPMEDEFTHARELSSRFVDLPIEQFRDFVSRTVEELDLLPSRLREATSETTINLTLTLTLEIEDGLEHELDAELKRLEALYDSY